VSVVAPTSVSIHGEKVVFFVRGVATFGIEFSELCRVAGRPFGQVVLQLAMRRGPSVVG